MFVLGGLDPLKYPALEVPATSRMCGVSYFLALSRPYAICDGGWSDGGSIKVWSDGKVWTLACVL